MISDQAVPQPRLRAVTRCADDILGRELRDIRTHGGWAPLTRKNLRTECDYLAGLHGRDSPDLAGEVTGVLGLVLQQPPKIRDAGILAIVDWAAPFGARRPGVLGAVGRALSARNRGHHQEFAVAFGDRLGLRGAARCQFYEEFALTDWRARGMSLAMLPHPRGPDRLALSCA
jgi:hypothetical protein